MWEGITKSLLTSFNDQIKKKLKNLYGFVTTKNLLQRATLNHSTIKEATQNHVFPIIENV